MGPEQSSWTRVASPHYEYGQSHRRSLGWSTGVGTRGSCCKKSMFNPILYDDRCLICWFHSMRDSNLEFRIVDPRPSNFGYAAIISLESGLFYGFPWRWISHPCGVTAMLVSSETLVSAQISRNKTAAVSWWMWGNGWWNKTAAVSRFNEGKRLDPEFACA